MKHFPYKKTRMGNNVIDETVMNVLKNSKFDNQIVDFFPYGSDERQFCSPGINLPVGSLYRSDNKYLEFPEYHSSADNFSIISEKALAETLIKKAQFAHIKLLLPTDHIVAKKDTLNDLMHLNCSM